LPDVENYFNYFTEIEEHFQRRRGTVLLLSTLDWSLIETWKDAGIPLEAVLRGIDAAFDSWERRPSKTRKVNSLAYCAQQVLAAVEDAKESEVGTERVEDGGSGFEPAAITAFLERCAVDLEKANVPGAAQELKQETILTLRKLSADVVASGQTGRLEDIDRRLTVMEEKLFAALLAATPDEKVVAVRSDADRELAPYRRKMPGAQIDQLLKQYLQKRLFEQCKLPRLSLFYM